MKKINTYILLLMLLISALGFSQEEKVKAEIDTTNIRIGEQFTYKISVDGTEKVIIPKPTLKGLEVVESLKMDTIKNRLVKKYRLTGFDSGAFYIPQQKINIDNKEFLTDSLLVNVANIKVDKEIKEFNIKTIKDEPYTFNDFRHLWWIVLIVVLIIAIAVYFIFFYKKKEPEKIIPKLKPYDFAIQELNNLDKKLLWQNNKIKEYYSELTDIIRTYIEDEFGVPALESTSDEIVKKLSRLHRKKEIIAPNETLNKLSNLLQIADLVKFAKMKPLANEIENDRKDAGYIVDNIKVPEPEKEENETEKEIEK